MRSEIKQIAKVLLNPGSLRYRIVKKVATTIHILPSSSPDINYSEWVERTEPFSWSKLKILNEQPLISIIVPVYNPPAKYFYPMVYSVVNQENYENWELVLVNASSNKKIKKLADEITQIDRRIKVINTLNKGIAQNTNLGINQAKGEYIGLLDHDDTLAPRALYEVGRLLQDENKPGLIYSDEDKITEDGRYRFDVHFKPDWSFHLLKQVNYINHFTVIKKSLIDKIGGYRSGFEGAQDYDLFLRIVDLKPTIVHISKVLYHWRASPSSTAQNFSTKLDALQAGVRALEDHLVRNKQLGKVNYLANQPGFYTISYKPSDKTKLAVLILPTSNIKQYSYLCNHITKSLKTTKIRTIVFVADTIDQPLTSNKSIQFISVKAKDKTSFVNYAISQTDSDLLVIFNSAIIPNSNKWAEELSGLLTNNQDIGVVAPLLINSDGDTIKDAGLVRSGDITVGLFQGSRLKSHTYFGNTVWPHHVDYLSGRVFALRRDVFDRYFKKQTKIFDRNRMCHVEPYKQLSADGLITLIYSPIRMKFYGELSPVTNVAPYYNPNLSVIRYEPGLSKNINIPPEVNGGK